MLQWKPGQPLQLMTRRFTLQSVAQKDATPMLLAWLTDPKLMHFLGGPRPLSNLDDLKRYIATYDNKRKFWIGIFKERRLVGTIWIDTAPDDRNARTHHLIADRKLWGSSAALEARAAIIDWLFLAGFKRIFGTPVSECRSAIAGYRRQGFTYEGTFKSALSHPNGKRYDVCVFRMLPEEWAAQKQEKGPLGNRRDARGDKPPVAPDLPPREPSGGKEGEEGVL